MKNIIDTPFYFVIAMNIVTAIIMVSVFSAVSYVEDKGIMGATPNFILETPQSPTITCSYLNNTFTVAYFNIPWSYYNKNEYKYFVNSSYNGEREILDPKSGYITIASSNKSEYMSIIVENINTGNRTIMTYAKCEGDMK